MCLQRIHLKLIETQLNPEEFFQVHRSTIVKLSEVKEPKSLNEKQYAVALPNKKSQSKFRFQRRFNALTGNEPFNKINNSVC